MTPKLGGRSGCGVNVASPYSYRPASLVPTFTKTQFLVRALTTNGEISVIFMDYVSSFANSASI